ncbi:hypothetical protein MKW92_015683 [Papaver armeniacum]|nr:hypothetical protein MKW92_015683 [Papaver armeniacum]
MENRPVDTYKGIGEYLSRYTSGKLPKAFLSLTRTCTLTEAVIVGSIIQKVSMPANKETNYI